MIIIVNVVIVIRYIVITRPCGEEDQTTEHVAISNSASPKLYGGLEDLKKTTNFITAAGLVV